MLASNTAVVILGALCFFKIESYMQSLTTTFSEK